MSLPVQIETLISEINRLAEFSAAPAPAVTRVIFSKEDRAARDYLMGLAKEAGFSIRIDAVGNTFIRWEGSDPGRPAIATGSHIDAIPNAGKYDGVVGVLGGLEAMRALKRSGFQPKASLELICFTSEEPTRFGIGCLGSRLMAGSLSPEEADALKDADGKSLKEWRREAAWSGEDPGSARVAENTYSAFVELHIEQGPLLETAGLDIGVVEKIAAPAAFRIELQGDGGHAGAVLMPGRRDAGLGGAEIALAVEKAVKMHGSPDGVGTTGVFRIKPDAINSIPYQALLEIDIRDTDHAARKRVEETLHQAVEQISQSRNLQSKITTINSDPPATADETILKAIESACAEEGFGYQRMISRAYHDTLFMARLAPVSMIFIPCFKGYSHRPDEFASPEHIRRGVVVLAHVMARLSST
jgi:N-carbamoyl-L-amino-acid hydrolase